MTFSDLRVLYVEDEVIVAVVTAGHLRSLGFAEVHVAHTLKRAGEIVDAGAVDIALLDVNLGRGERTTGLGRRLSDAGTQVVFISGYNRSELNAPFEGYEYLEKPVAFADLDSVLAAIAGRRAAAE